MLVNRIHIFFTKRRIFHFQERKDLIQEREKCPNGTIFVERLYIFRNYIIIT